MSVPRMSGHPLCLSFVYLFIYCITVHPYSRYLFTFTHTSTVTVHDKIYPIKTSGKTPHCKLVSRFISFFQYFLPLTPPLHWSGFLVFTFTGFRPRINNVRDWTFFRWHPPYLTYSFYCHHLLQSFYRCSSTIFET